MISKAGISFPTPPPSINTERTPLTIEVDAYSEEESSKSVDEDDDDDDEEYSTTTDSRLLISKVPIFISSPKIPDDIVLPNLQSQVSYTESDANNSNDNVSPIFFDPSSLETSHISSILVESNDTPITKTQSIEEEDYKTASSSSSSSISIKRQSSKQQHFIQKQTNKKEKSVKPQIKKEQNIKQTNKKEQNVKEQNIKQTNKKEQNVKEQNVKQTNNKKEQNVKQTNNKKEQNVKQKNVKQTSSYKSQQTSSYSTTPSSNQSIVILPQSKDKKNYKKETSDDDESIDIYSSSDTMTCKSGTFSQYSTTTSISESTKEKHQSILSEDSSLSANETIKTYVDDETKVAQRTIPPDPPTVCCVLV